MSYQQFRQQCHDCKLIWNAAFGMVHTTIIAEAPKSCPGCGSPNISHYAHGWDYDLWDMQAIDGGSGTVTMAPQPKFQPHPLEVPPAHIPAPPGPDLLSGFPPTPPNSSTPLLRRLGQALASLFRGRQR